MEFVLEVEGLSVAFNTPQGRVPAVEDVSFVLRPGETLALVGESGCGKSVSARGAMGLYGGSRVEQRGTVRLSGEDLTAATPERRAQVRGSALSMIFQEPMSSFDPLATVGEQMVDARLAHAGSGRSAAARSAARAAARAEAVEALRAVGIPDPETRIDDWPHKLSGGMLQRVLVATALMNEPAALIADEPTTALDVTIQAQVLRLLRDLRARTGMGVLFITHDLGVVAEIADRVHVMYAGRIVERGSAAEIFSDPAHPYSKGLLESRVRRDLKGGRLPAIPGSVPRPGELPVGCRFAPRCAFAGPRCSREEPRLDPDPLARDAACWLRKGGVS